MIMKGKGDNMKFDIKIDGENCILTMDHYIEIRRHIDNLNDMIKLYVDENYILNKHIDAYKKEFSNLNKQIRKLKKKIRRNRKLFEVVLDEMMKNIDEDILKQTFNVDLKDYKNEFLKNYDKD